MEIKLTKDNFENEVLHSDKPVMVDFWASWCGPCKMLGPVLSELAEEYSGVVKVGKVNVDEESELAMRYQITAIPAVLLFENGRVVNSSVGYVSKEKLAAML